MSIVPGGSATPSPFLRIYTDLNEKTHSTTTFKNFASIFKEALAQHAETYNIPMFESTTSTSVVSANAAAVDKAGTKDFDRRKSLGLQNA